VLGFLRKWLAETITMRQGGVTPSHAVSCYAIFESNQSPTGEFISGFGTLIGLIELIFSQPSTLATQKR
jgi:hypothetical protein